MIFENVDKFLEWRDDCDAFLDYHKDLIMTSGGFDPLHVGHLRCIQETVLIAKDTRRFPKALRPMVVVVVNCDDFLRAKKGYNFMSLKDRMEIIHVAGEVVALPQREDGTRIYRFCL